MLSIIYPIYLQVKSLAKEVMQLQAIYILVEITVHTNCVDLNNLDSLETDIQSVSQECVDSAKASPKNHCRD